jgi:hypothetical protein
VIGFPLIKADSEGDMVGYEPGPLRLGSSPTWNVTKSQKKHMTSSSLSHIPGSPIYDMSHEK